MKKTAVITGASRGIGRSIAQILAKEGFNLALICKNNYENMVSYTNELIKLYNIDIITFQGDVSNYDFIKKMATATLEKFTRIDILINNAGIAHLGLLTDMTYEQWEQIIGVNLNSLFFTAKAFVPTMVSNKSGKIINISSMWGNVGASCEVAYSASKGGVNAFTKALAKELAPSNISVNAIACGVIDTDMNAQLSEDEKADLIADIPCDRMGTPEDVAKTVLNIINSPTYMTGQIIGLDGGYI